MIITRIDTVGFIFSSLGAGEILVVLVVALLLFGADRLPALARLVGQALHKMQQASNELTQTVRDVAESPSADQNASARNQKAIAEGKKPG